MNVLCGMTFFSHSEEDSKNSMTGHRRRGEKEEKGISFSPLALVYVKPNFKNRSFLTEMEYNQNMECCTSSKDMRGTGGVTLAVTSPFGDVLCVPADVHSVSTTRTLCSWTSLKICI